MKPLHFAPKNNRGILARAKIAAAVIAKRYFWLLNDRDISYEAQFRAELTKIIAKAVEKTEDEDLGKLEYERGYKDGLRAAKRAAINFATKKGEYTQKLFKEFYKGNLK